MSGEKQICCTYCENEKLTKSEIGLNKKLIHRQIERMMCLRCLTSYLETTEEELREMIDGFKLQGCALFG